MLNGVEVDIDSWPLIPTYLEIEGPSEKAVYDTIALLGLEDAKVTSKDVNSIYLDYGHDISQIFELKLEEERK